jgi:hypothetical protein
MLHPGGSQYLLLDDEGVSTSAICLIAADNSFIWNCSYLKSWCFTFFMIRLGWKLGDFKGTADELGGIKVMMLSLP